MFSNHAVIDEIIVGSEKIFFICSFRLVGSGRVNSFSVSRKALHYFSKSYVLGFRIKIWQKSYSRTISIILDGDTNCLKERMLI
jgi:hypothetical protein